MSNRTFGLLVGLPAVAILGAILFFQFDVGKRQFDPDAVANRIVLAVGASNAKNTRMTGPVCAVASARICMGHDANPLQVQDTVDRTLRTYRVTPTGPWEQSSTGTMRFYRYSEDSRPRVLSVAVTPEVLVIDW